MLAGFSGFLRKGKRYAKPLCRNKVGVVSEPCFLPIGFIPIFVGQRPDRCRPWSRRSAATGQVDNSDLKAPHAVGSERAAGSMTFAFRVPAVLFRPLHIDLRPATAQPQAPEPV